MTIHEDFYNMWLERKAADEFGHRMADDAATWATRTKEARAELSEKIEELEKCKKDLRDLRSDLAEKWQEIRNLKDAYGAFRLRNAELCKQLTQKNLQIAELLEAKDAPEPDVTFDPQPE